MNELRDEVGAEDFFVVAEIFLEEVEEVMDRLRANPDPSTYETELHFLKGSALNLGFSALADQSGLDEKQARGPERDNIDLAKVIHIYEKSKIEFNGGHSKKECAA